MLPPPAAVIADIFDEYRREMIAVLCRSWQATVYDPTWGGNELWSVLHRAAQAALGGGKE